jgi:hypothetical protein
MRTVSDFIRSGSSRHDRTELFVLYFSHKKEMGSEKHMSDMVLPVVCCGYGVLYEESLK